jgi:hypothetical protein
LFQPKTISAEPFAPRSRDNPHFHVK